MSLENLGNTQQRIPAELKRVREAAGLSQEQMATRLGMDYAPGGRRVSTGRAAVSAWERGRRTPSTEQLRAYVDLGGDPAILALRPDLQQREPAADTSAAERVPRAVPTPRAESGESVPAEPTETSRPVSRSKVLWKWFAFVLAVAAGAVVLVVALRGGPASPQGPVSTWTETTGTPAHTWADATQLTGAGTPLGPRQSVQVLCRARGYIVQDGDPWWYRLASEPWNGRFYATSDAFYNNGATSGPVDTGVVVDEQVPVCPGS